MSYQKQNFSDGEVLQASHLNHIEEGITNLEQEINKLPNTSEQITQEVEKNIIEKNSKWKNIYH